MNSSLFNEEHRTYFLFHVFEAKYFSGRQSSFGNVKSSWNKLLWNKKFRSWRPAMCKSSYDRKTCEGNLFFNFKRWWVVYFLYLRLPNHQPSTLLVWNPFSVDIPLCKIGLRVNYSEHYHFLLILLIFSDHKFYLAKVDLQQIDIFDYFGGNKHVSVQDYYSANITLIINSDVIFTNVAVLEIDN